ncbi:MAG: amidohydrolase [Ilumatobacteraceae bacterium]
MADGQPVDDVVDAHVHVWDPGAASYPWLAEVPQLARPFGLDEVEIDHRAAGVRQLVLVQAADGIDDTEHMLATARSHPQVAGVVAWVPLHDADEAESWLDRWRDEPIVGVRHLVHRDPDPDFLLAPEVDEAFELLADRGLSFDVCAETTHLLQIVPPIAERHPDLTLVIDHLAKPPIRDRGWQPWARLLTDAAQAPNVVAKLSGLNTAAAPGATSADFAPYVEHALEVFGHDRILYGGDWPFASLAAGSYTAVWTALRGCLDHLAPDHRHAVLAQNARRVYRLPSPANVAV